MPTRNGATLCLFRAGGLLEYITRDCLHLLSFFEGELSLLLARSEVAASLRCATYHRSGVLRRVGY